MQLVLRAGVPTLQGGAVTAQETQAKVRVPDLFSLFRIDRAESRIVRNKAGEPEQFLIVHTTSAAKTTEVAKQLQAWILPARNPNVERPAEQASADMAEPAEREEEESEDASEEPARTPAAPEVAAFDDWWAGQVNQEILKMATPVKLSAAPAAEEEGQAAHVPAPRRYGGPYFPPHSQRRARGGRFPARRGLHQRAGGAGA